MYETKTCLICPVGCEITYEQNNINSIKGNRCGRGKEFIINTFSEKKSIVSGRVKINGGIMSKIPVNTDIEVDSILAERILEEIKQITLNAPIKNGDVVIENILDSGVNIIAGRTMKAKN